MKLESGKFCPFIKKDCIGLTCSLFTQVRGTNPQSGAEVDEWACSFAWLPMLLINTAQEVRQAAAATESSRNATVDALGRVLKTHVAMATVLGAATYPSLDQKE